MAAPRKKKRGPPFDVTGIDFSVITTALETGGKMIEQIIDGIHYGSPEVRLLMLEECDLIIECRVCRGLFRALPNFIAHKRVYCCQAYCNHSQNQQFQAATACEPPQEQPVIVEPKAPEEANRAECPDSHGQAGQCKERGRGEKKEGSAGGLQPASRGDKSREKDHLIQGKAQVSSDTAGNSWIEEATDPSQTKAQSQHKRGDGAALGSLAETVRQIQSGQLGRSKAYAVYTAAAEKMEREKANTANTAPLHLTAIPTNPCAVFVKSGNVTANQTVSQPLSNTSSQPASSLQTSLPDIVTGVEKDKTKNSSDSVAKGTMSAGSVKPAAGGSSISQATRKAGVAKGTLRNVTRVVRELRQKKEESVTKKKAVSKDQAGRAVRKTSPPTTLNPPPRLAAPTTQASASPNRLGKWEDGKQQGVPVTIPKGIDPPTSRRSDRGGSLRAVVKRCLTGRPGALRMSPHKAGSGERTSDLDGLMRPGERSSDVDSISEAGSFSDRGETPSPSGLLRQRDEESPDQSAMDLDNMRCKICNMVFLRRKSLVYHCQTRHSGQRTIFPCPYCPRVFYYFWGLTRHLNTNHKKSPSDIDRMRKSLRRKAYKQDVNDGCAKQTPSASPEDKDRDAAPRRSRPSVAARKVVAVAKSSTEPNKIQPSVAHVSGRRRRVEVIASVCSKSRKAVDVYRKVYPSKGHAAPAGSPPAASPQSSPSKDRTRRTRRLVAKALRTTRSKRVYNRAGEEALPDISRATERSHKPEGQSLRGPAGKRNQRRPKMSRDTVCHTLGDDGSSSVPSSVSEPHTAVQRKRNPDIALEAIVSQKFLVQTGASSLNVEKLMPQPPANAGRGTSVLEHPAGEVDSTADIIANSKTGHQEGVLQKEAEVGSGSDVLKLKASAAADALSSDLGSKTCSESKTGAEARMSIESKMSSEWVTNEVATSCESATNSDLKIGSSCRGAGEGLKPQSQTRTQTAASASSLAVTTPGASTISQAAPLTRAKSSATPGLPLTTAAGTSVGHPASQTYTKTSAIVSSVTLMTGGGAAAGQTSPQTKTPSVTAGLNVTVSSGAAAIQMVPQTTATTGITLTDPGSATVIHKKTTPTTAGFTLMEPNSATIIQTAPQTRTKAATATIGSVLTAPLSGATIIQTAPQTRTKTPTQEVTAAVLNKTLQVHITRAKRSSSAPVPDDSSTPSLPALLHICPHCQRVFGRKISLDSHVKICSKAKSTPLTSLQRKKDGSMRTAQGHGSHNNCTEPGGSRTRTRGENPAQGLKAESRGDRSVRRVYATKPAHRTLEDEASLARPSTRNLKDVLQDKSELVPRSQQKSAAPQRNKTAQTADNRQSRGRRQVESDAADGASRSQRSSRNVNSRSGSSRESSVESREASKDSETRTHSKTLERQCRSHRDSKTSSSRDSSADSVRMHSSDTIPAQPPPPESKTKRSGQDSCVGIQGRASVHDKTKPEEDLLTISRQRFSEHLQAATTTKNRDSSEDASGLRSASRRTRDNTESLKTVVNKIPSQRLPPQRTVTTTVLRRNPMDKIADTGKTPSHETRAGPTTKRQEAAPKADLQAVSTQAEQDSTEEGAKLLKQPESVLKKPQTAAGSTPKVQHVFQEGRLGGKPREGHRRTEVSASKQQPQGSMEVSQRPRRKRRAPAKIMEQEDECQESENSTDSTKKLRLDPSKLSDDSTSELVPATEPHPPHYISMEAEEVDNEGGGRGEAEENKSDNEERSVTLVEEIWMEKKPGRPTERVKSNRIYVVEPARAGRLTCQDTRKVRQIVDEGGLTCLQCKQQFTSVSNLRRHAIRHLGWRRYKCRLCCFCSYNKSECKTHILRTHPERLHSRVRVDTYITDLSRKAASVRSQKKRQTLDSRRREGEEGGGVRRAGATHRKAWEMSRETKKPTAGGDSSTSSVGTPSAPPKHSTSRRKSATPSATPISHDTQRSKPSKPTTFNISTRNSPRKFDTRPYTPPDTIATLNTRKGSYIKAVVSPFLHSLAQVTAEDAKRVLPGAKEKQTGQTSSRTVPSAPRDKDLPPSSSHPGPTHHGHLESGGESEPILSSPVATADSSGEKSKEVAKADRVVPDLLETMDEEEQQKRLEPAVGDMSTAREEEGTAGAGRHQGGASGGFVATQYEEDGDLMNVAMGQMHTLPEQFMSDDSQSPVNIETCDESSMQSLTK